MFLSSHHCHQLTPEEFCGLARSHQLLLRLPLASLMRTEDGFLSARNPLQGDGFVGSVPAPHPQNLLVSSLCFLISGCPLPAGSGTGRSHSPSAGCASGALQCPPLVSHSFPSGRTSSG